VNPLDFRIRSEWMIPKVETLRILNNLGDETYNEELSSLQYTDKNQEKALLVIVDKKGKTGSVTAKIAQGIISFLEETKFTKVFVFGETQTNSAYDLLKYNDRTRVFTSNSGIQLSTEDVLEAFHQFSMFLCVKACSRKANEGGECKSTRKRSEKCKYGAFFDNAKFHARMSWNDQLLQDFSSLIEYKQVLLRDN